MKQEASTVLMLFVWIFSLQWYICTGMTCPDVQCDFTKDLCGWASDNGGNGAGFDWHRGSYSSNVYARLDVSNTNGPASSELQSPLLDSQAGHTCQLTFKSYLGGSSVNGQSPCGLSVIQRSENGSEIVLVATLRQATGTSFISVGFTNYGSVAFDCQSGSKYQIIFRGSVLSGNGNSCGTDNQIAVDDIACTATLTPTTTTTTRPVDTTQLTTTVPGPEETSTCVECTTDDSASSPSAGLGPGATAGIVIAVVAVIAVVVVIVVVFRRRRSEGGKLRDPAPNIHVNTGFQPDSATKDATVDQDRHNKDNHGDSHHGNDIGRSAPAFQNVESPRALPGDAVAAQTTQKASSNVYQPFAAVAGKTTQKASNNDHKPLAAVADQINQNASNNDYEPLVGNDVVEAPYDEMTFTEVNDDNKNEDSADEYLAAVADQTNQNDANNDYEPLVGNDADETPYDEMTLTKVNDDNKNEDCSDTYEPLSRADSHVYSTMANQNRDSDGYECPVALVKPIP